MDADKYKIILLGLSVHILLLLAVCDTYFSSPLENGMRPVRATPTPPAKRLVLFVADGLRAESIYADGNQGRAPFLTRISKSQGSWGVAHTRVPTESRPGHVAMLAGIYEDPSAIFKGWAANPVYFDSVINQSANAWCWGSPSIVSIFNRDSLSKIHLYTYSGEMEDFGQRDTGLLDVWVFDRVETFLRRVRDCTRNCEEYFAGGNLFFLHLLGIDTAGHGYKPHSKEVVANIRLVDERIKKTVALVDGVFADNATSYIFTSDHGMTDWGSHGAGLPHETEVPFIAWGAGIKRNDRRQDLNQINIAGFMSSLIGINIPTNSLGTVPVEYLDLEKENLGKVVLANAEQLFEIFKVKKRKIERNAMLHLPFSEDLSDKFARLIQLQESRMHDDLIFHCQHFMEVLNDGIKYYQNYYKYPILLSVSLGFILWVIFLALTISGSKPNFAPDDISVDKFLMYSLIILIIFGLCFKSNFPFTYYLYFLFPMAMVLILDSWQHVSFVEIFLETSAEVFTSMLLYFAGLELLVYGFFNRSALSVLLVFLGVVLPRLATFKDIFTTKEASIWLCLCLVLAIFPSLPVMTTFFSVPLYLFGYLEWVFFFMQTYESKNKLYRSAEFNVQFKVFVVQFCCLQVAAVYMLLLEMQYISNDSALKYISWVILILPIAVIPFSSKIIALRLAATFFGFAPFYLLVSPNYELVFSAFYVMLLSFWLFIETKSVKQKNASVIYYSKFDNYRSRKSVTSDNFRRAFLFMVFIFVGFFGTGNIASLNSFDPMWTRAFLTVFSPFKMTCLILLKIMVPFIFTCCVFRAINAIGRERVLHMFCIILMFSDLMVLQFLYLITNEGSWLDIGTSLSHFLIMEGFVTILLLLYGVAHWITSVNYKLKAPWGL